MKSNFVLLLNMYRFLQGQQDQGQAQEWQQAASAEVYSET